MKKKPLLGVAIALFTTFIAYADSVKVTTFFPSPKGVYRQLETSGDTLLTTSGGNVGIGTTAPTTKLDVRGQVRIAGGTPDVNKVLAAQDATGLAYWKGGPWLSDVTGVGTSTYLAKWTGNKTLAASSIFYVPSSGHIGIGTTDPQATLSIGGSGLASYSVYAQEDRAAGYAVYGRSTHGQRGYGIYANANNAGAAVTSYGLYAIGSSVGVYGKGTGTGAGLGAGVGAYGKAPSQAVNGSGTYGVYGESSGTGYGVYGNTNTANGWSLYCEGAKCGGTQGWSLTSDIRLKTNIVPIPDALEKIRKLRGVTFEWKNEPGKRDMGFVAQEVLPVLPEVIETNPYGYYGMKQDEITAVLIEAAKEQQKQIDALQKEVNNLKNP